MIDNDPLWYKDAVIYEIHVRAAFDSDGDGIGDFRGLTQKLDYFQDLGITALWILPFYPSPLRDDGYDIADYTSVNPQYGNLRDFQEFLQAAHRRGIRVITELVINHTSDQHPWFQRARHAPPGSSERDFYVWSDTDTKFKGVRIIFKDFERSNWTWDPIARAYYWHRFYSHQPDLNYDNPAVWKAIFPLLDFWFDLGVDGLRLDAIPYLYERENTTCENLPETHAFLQALRKHVDERHPGRMLLAEANQWPEDAVAYFGEGDECHMAFHFPVMPRLFMALHQESSFPIIDILAQTPQIPENCQWAMFLRNHDELTLEMVTDEERDYMYRAYAADSQARINLGIRRRLAPLLRNDRRRIELLNALLFSLPGTPVLYYGDEIGMGDNIYLGDRNGVRTPMQWSGDRNAGFSRTNPQRLYLPVIIDPEYHFEALNVEAQQNNSNSLLWWMKRLIALRKSHKALSRGTLEFVRGNNPKVLAFIRKIEPSEPGIDTDQILVVANLTRFVQHVELDLSQQRGLMPEELFGRSLFPVIGETPYSFTLTQHSSLWFALLARRPGETHSRPEEEIPLLELSENWHELFDPANIDRLEEVLPGFLTRRRERAVAVHVDIVFPITFDNAKAYLLMARVEDDQGLTRTDAFPLIWKGNEPDGSRPRLPPGSVVARLGGPTQGVLCDAIVEVAFCQAVFRALIQGRSYRIGADELVMVPLGGLAEEVGPAPDSLTVTPGSFEHSNFSIRYGEQYHLKVYRRLESGINPELEMGRFLSEKAKFSHMSPLCGYIEFHPRNTPATTLAVLHRYVENHGDAWQLALDQLSSFFERVLALPRERQAEAPHLIPFGELPHDHAAFDDLVGSYLATARLLGQRTAELHRALASDLIDPAFAPEPFTRPYQRSLYQTMRTLIATVFEQLAQQMSALPDTVRPRAETVLANRDNLLRRARGWLEKSFTAARIRCHGDYHLDNLLDTGTDLILIDLEGDSGRPMGERRIKRCCLWDLASLIRSLHQAAMGALYGLATPRGRAPGLVRDEDRALLEPWTRAWIRRTVHALNSTYFAGLEGTGLVPDEEADRVSILELMTLEKALRDLSEELAANPERALVPLLAVHAYLEQ
jgi:maltose alpha-D-glucosyltransferase / alpha-amylase